MPCRAGPCLQTTCSCTSSETPRHTPAPTALLHRDCLSVSLTPPHGTRQSWRHTESPPSYETAVARPQGFPVSQRKALGLGQSRPPPASASGSTTTVAAAFFLLTAFSSLQPCPGCSARPTTASTCSAAVTTRPYSHPLYSPGRNIDIFHPVTYLDIPP